MAGRSKPIRWRSPSAINGKDRPMENLISREHLFDTITPLFLALHRSGVLDISETALVYEDVLAKRRLNNQESEESTDFLAQVVQGLHRLAVAEKSQRT